MTKIQGQKGFTLVELAIVMTIIGLLIGGILKGQELMNTARITSTVAQVKSYEAAVTTFRDAYNAIPGDMPLADQRLQNCTLGCRNTAATAGDGVVGTVLWAAGATWAAQGATTTGSVAAGTVAAETWQFWAHLLQANLIGGVTNTSILTANTPYAWSTTHPAAKIGGGFIVGNNQNGVVPPGSTVATGGPAGLILVLTQAPTDAVSNAAAVAKPLSAQRAEQIDRKMDDGVPGNGYVQAYGLAATAAGGTGCYITIVAGVSPYNASGTGSACGLVFRIQG